MLKEIIFAPDALHDLSSIASYSKTRWGEQRTKRYLQAIQQKISELSQNPEMGTPRENLFENIRSLMVNSHIIYYRLNQKSLEIVRILHGRQDPLQLR